MAGLRGWRLLNFINGILFVITTANASAPPLQNSITSPDDLQPAGPKLSINNTEITLNQGENYTITCRGDNGVHFKKQESELENWGNFDVTILSVDENTKTLVLNNVDEYAVGYYACFDDTINSSSVLHDVVKEPVDDNHITYFYVFVAGSNSLLAPTSIHAKSIGTSKYLIKCRPTMPDIDVYLTPVDLDFDLDNYDPKIGIIINVLNDDEDKKFHYVECTFTSEQTTKHMSVIISRDKPPPKPVITATPKTIYFLPGESFTLNCSIAYQKNVAVTLDWQLPTGSKDNSSVIYESNESNVKSGIYFHSLTVENASKHNEGYYTCLSKTEKSAMTQYKKQFVDKPFITAERGTEELIETFSKEFNLRIYNIKSYPLANLTIFKNEAPLKVDGVKYILRKTETSYSLIIKHLDVYDTANYTFVLSNNFVEERINTDLRKYAAPTIDCGSEEDRKFMINVMASIACDVIGYPLPEILWSSRDIRTNEKLYLVQKNPVVDVENIYKLRTIIDFPVTMSSYVSCNASNSRGIKSVSTKILAHEVLGGFGIVKPNREWFAEGQNVEIKCYASIYDYANVTWIGYGDAGIEEKVVYSNSTLSHIATLTFDHIDVSQGGNYTCTAYSDDGIETQETVNLYVKLMRLPVVVEPKLDLEEKVLPFQSKQLSCLADAVPEPDISWFKDGVEIIVEDPEGDVQIKEYTNDTVLNSTIYISQIHEQHQGRYECRATSAGHSAQRFYEIVIDAKPPFKYEYLSIIVVLFLLLLALVFYLGWKIKKEKRFRKELAAAGLLHFKEGLTSSINPELGITEQAINLPYDDRFEFPPDKLRLGKQLGAGAFGVVYKAEARGIVNAEETTTVAVKMVKKTAENMHIMALASELKIMVHMGKHVNIVNLLGACTNNVGKRELMMIVEYCRYGNIHNYLQKHRDVFIDQLTDNKVNKFGKVNRGFSYSVGTAGTHSDYFGSNQSQNTENTFLNTASSNRSSRKLSDTGYVQPEWRSNYEGDYSDDGRTPRPLCSRDLICWAFQIARGMEYLAERKVLHGDLAARNILLADDNVVKICDFGLARSIYMNDEYQKKEHSLLPVKWLAIECLTDRIFSTQSDVWAFGIVLWELFSLAKTPYPNIGPNHLLQWLSDGRRLDKPAHADDRLYELMLQCWQQKPTSRPSFSQLQLTLGSYLEDSVRNHYVDLNEIYTELNAAKRESGQEDYLAMMSSPDYNNQVSPDGHHYVNEAGAHCPPPLDADGYLQMTPSRDTRSPKFDCDVRKLNQYTDNPETTPMLTLHNLPRGSESDQEDTASPQYMNYCPKIEEVDEVFENNENNKKDIAKNTVTNPTYLTIKEETKPSQNENKGNVYINVNSNGLVIK